MTVEAEQLDDVPRVNAKPEVIAEAFRSFTGADDLLHRAESSTSKRTRNLRDRITADLLDLDGRLRAEVLERAEQEKAEKVRAAAEAELAKAREALARAEERARQAGAKTSTRTAFQRDHDPKAVRAWAATNGVTCPAKGRVPGPVVKAWRKATNGAA